MARVTHKQIAEATGLTRAAVSMALSGKRGVSDATRKRVREAAERLGYHPDPALRVLSDLRWEKPAAHTVAFAIYTRTRDQPAFLERVLAGFRNECDRRQMILECYAEVDFRNPERLEQVLRARGTDGVLIGFEGREAQWTPRPEFRDFAVIGTGSMPTGLSFHQVRLNHFQMIEQAWSRIVALGHRRIGFIHVAGEPPSEVDRRRLAFYHMVQEVETAVKDRIPAFRHPLNRRGNLGAWLDRYEPDALLTVPIAGSILDAASERDLPVFSLSEGGKVCPGMNIDPTEIGVAAFGLLEGLFRQGNRGPSTNPQALLINGRWFDHA